MEARDWLPREAFAPTAVAAALTVAVEAWATCWFADAGRLTVAAEEIQGGVPAVPPLDSCEGRAVSAGLSGYGKRVLLEAYLGARLDSASLTEADHRLLDSISSRVIRDLVDRLDGELGAGVAGEQQLNAAVLAGDGNEMVRLHLPLSALAPLLKARIAASKEEVIPVARRRALEASEAVLQAHLGRVSLAMDELRGIAVGDVLVLDAVLEGPVELRLRETGQTVGFGRLERGDGPITIRI